MNLRCVPVARLLVFFLALVATQPGIAAGALPSPLQFTLDALPEKDIWAGLAFGNAKVGYAHVSVRPVDEGHYEIRSETMMVLRMLGFEKSVEMRVRDRVRGDLTLVQFESEFSMDGNLLRVSGRAEGSRLLLSLENAGATTARELAHDGRLFPASAIGFLPLVKGIEAGRSYRYAAFNPESLNIARVEQRVELEAGVEGAAFAVRSSMEGQDGVTWLDGAGRFIAESALRGAFRATQQSEHNARAFVMAARESRQDVIVDLSLVRVDRAISLPRRIDRMRIALEGIALDLPSDAGQRCSRNAAAWECDIDSSQRGTLEGDSSAWLRASFTVPSADPAIVKLSREITSDATTGDAKARAILRWLDANIRKEAADGFTALDVLATRRAECQGHAYLYAALARAAGVPTRVVNGLVYSEAQQGFLYHTWTESLLEDGWRALDPTFGQAVADATHLKIVEGEDYADIAPLMGLIGRVRARVDSYEYRR